ncbi:MAG: hypothetical protein M1838_002042 [Thelocarpon superellum]|nr:MAG: hypothetical protein M1838_002042 [Thelocarpon superellum]
MFDILAKLLSSIATFLFPVFASYKALKGNDPAQLTPWLMYWVVLACGLLVESWTEWILVWFPFYPWIRAFTLLYLVMPQTQGARFLYQTQIHPFLSRHEAEIDTFITSAHDRARAAGLQYLKQAIELIKEHVFGLPPNKPTPPPASYGGSYAQTLLAQFNLPARRDGYSVPAAGDFYDLLSAALGHAIASSPMGEARAEDLSTSGTLIPATIRGREDRLNYISTQRERLRVLSQALDHEASNISRSTDGAQEYNLPGSLAPEGLSSAALRRSKSEGEGDFERVEREDVGDEGSVAAGGWMPWHWGGSAKAPDAHPTTAEGSSTATSTAVDASTPS